ncbi:MAG TPA: ATP-binding protein [Terriglobales bacterium]|nr:ATP-binding protein [Terriglobales bacterium]
MRSLFLKIFLSFWLATALFVALAIVVTVAMRPTRHISEVEALQTKFLNDAISAYQAGGTDHLRDYLRSIRDSQHIRAVLFRDGESLLGHTIPPWFTEVAKGRRRTTDTLLGRLNPRFQMLRASTTGADGHNYMLVVELPPGQNALLGPNGVPGLGILIAVLVSGLVCYFLARFLTAPILRLRKATQQLASGDLSARVGGQPSLGGDELSQLVHDFDLMAEQIEKLVNAQSRLLKDISHELRSPLARLCVALELARQRTGPEAQSVLDRISLESNRMNELIGSLTTIARLESGAGTVRMQAVELEDVVQEVARDAAFEAQARNIQVECEILDELPVMGDPALLRSAIENVVRNASRYTPEGTAVYIRAERRASAGSGEAVVRVQDSGPGVPAGELDKIFQPFYRIDDARGRSTGGVGLGLAITDQAIRLHGGSVRASNLPEGGLMVEMCVPLQGRQEFGEPRDAVVAEKTS